MARHHALRGNVETEIARRDDIGAGCGCAYPDEVDHGIVRRSNEILSELREGAAPEITERPRRTADAPRRAGSANSASASCTAMRPRSPAGASRMTRSTIRQQRPGSTKSAARPASICSPRPTPALRRLREFELPGRLTVINNGAAGMPNFSGTHFGLISRIATTPLPASGTLRHRPRRGVHRRPGGRLRPAAFLEPIPRPLARRLARPRLVLSPHHRRSLLSRWSRRRAARVRVMLSIIIPVLDEAATIASALRRSRRCARAAPR